MGRLQMNNKPIAWMYNYENFPDSFVVCRARKSDQDIPLYTHPVKDNFEEGYRAGYKFCAELYEANPVKELTDEEIAIIGDKCFGTMHYELWLRTNEFARAILRKAQE